MFKEILINDAYSQETATAQQSEFSFASLVPLILIFTVFYFLIIRPQSKKFKDHQTMVNALKTGDKVITTGGIIGVVVSIDQEKNQVEIEIANNVNVKLMRNFVSELVKKEEKNKK